MEDADQWAIIYSHNRDSGLLDQSNAAVIEKALEPFTEGDDPDVVFESHPHWAVGHVDGFSIRVFDGTARSPRRSGRTSSLRSRWRSTRSWTRAITREREYEATLENIEDAAWQAEAGVRPAGRLGRATSIRGSPTTTRAEIENRDDQGGYPSEESLRAAFEALGYKEQE